jgi:uncharacterized protein YaaQ
MKMILAVVQADDASKVVQALNDAGHRVTRIATQGAWLRRENATLLIGVQDNEVDHVLRVLKRTAQRRTSYINVPGEVAGMFNPQPLEVEVGGATVFVLNVERFERLDGE